MTQKRLTRQKKSIYKHLPLLTPSECAEVRDRVIELRPLWHHIYRPGPLKGAPCYRLGSALEHPKKTVGYEERSREFNRILKKNFGELYKKILECLTDYFKQPVIFRPKSSLPGFRIIVSDAIFGEHGAPWHTDFDSLLLKWSKPINFKTIRTMTLPVCLPTSGATLDVKDLTFEDMMFEKRGDGFRKIVEETKILEHIPHKLGQILVQEGQRFHRIGMLQPPYIEGEMRITLQGYMVPQHDHWELHW
jgi:hypothetical protein